MKKKRLYTYRERDRFTGVCFLAIFLLMDLFIFVKAGYSDIFKMAMVCSFAIYIIIEVASFPGWFFSARKKRKAIENGWLYMGKYVDIEKRVKDSPKHDFYGFLYMIKIEIEVDNEKIIINDGIYGENPGYYIRKNQQCRVYRYEDKYYPEIIYYEPKKDRTYIFDLSE